MRARTKVCSFLAAVAACVCAIPVLQQVTAPPTARVPWLSRELFTFDRFLGWVAGPLVNVGVSMRPSETVVGYDGWQFLGDLHQDAISQHRLAASAQDDARNSRLVEAGVAWESWLRRRGVKLFRIMVPPDKQSVYPEQAPSWARTIPGNPLEQLQGLDDGGVRIFLAPALVAARAAGGPQLFYAHDSHWNEAGAWVGYTAFAEAVGGEVPEVRWIAPDFFSVVGSRERLGGDLARFLHLEDSVREEVPVLWPAPAEGINSTVALEELPDLSVQGRAVKLARHHTSGALNTARVLWLTDSFGEALRPFMERTFSDVAIIHWGTVMPRPRHLAALVAREQPDYVFVTAVERMCRERELTSMPPADKGSG